MAGLLTGELPRVSRPLETDETDRLVALATLIVRARSAVERDGYSRDIELVPGSEAPTRFVVVLDRLLAGLDAIGLERDEAWRVVTRVALDSVPALRMAVLRALEPVDVADTNVIAGAVRHPAGTTRRALEDLTAHGLVNQHRHGEGKAHEWSLSEFARERLGGFPEKSSNARSERDRGFPGLPTFRESSGRDTRDASATDEAA